MKFWVVVVVVFFLIVFEVVVVFQVFQVNLFDVKFCNIEGCLFKFVQIKNVYFNQYGKGFRVFVVVYEKYDIEFFEIFFMVLCQIFLDIGFDLWVRLLMFVCVFDNVIVFYNNNMGQGEVIVIFIFFDVEYLILVDIGNFFQMFFFCFDMGFFDLWVFSSNMFVFQ